VNWKAIVIYGIGLSITQIAIGFAAGFFGANSLLSVWDLASFAMCTALFVHLAIRHKNRPLTHACLALAFYGGIWLALAALVSGFLSSVPPLLIGLEWLGLVVSMAVGLSIGKAIRHAPGEPA
jgi:hypothetical protein